MFETAKDREKLPRRRIDRIIIYTSDLPAILLSKKINMQERLDDIIFQKEKLFWLCWSLLLPQAFL